MEIYRGSWVNFRIKFYQLVIGKLNNKLEESQSLWGWGDGQRVVGCGYRLVVFADSDSTEAKHV
jgi:hypothetical protein